MPTNNPVPSQDPSDLLFNAGKLDEVLNGTGNSFTDRLGVARRTVAGMNADFDAQLADAESDLNVYRADAAASAAQVLGYLNTIRTTSYGAYASDPATDPLGNPPNVGDEYFNTTSNLLKRFNGTTWQASDINTANLAAPSGSSLVGYDGQTVQDVLDGAKSLQDYAELRSYTGRATRIYITGLLATVKPSGIAGVFQYDVTDTTSADNGGTIIVSSDSRRWKRLLDGAVNVKWFGAKGDGIADDTTEIEAAATYAASVNSCILLTGETYIVSNLTLTVDANFVGNGTIRKKPGTTGHLIYSTANLKINGSITLDQNAENCPNPAAINNSDCGVRHTGDTIEMHGVRVLPSVSSNLSLSSKKSIRLIGCNVDGGMTCVTASTATDCRVEIIGGIYESSTRWDNIQVLNSRSFAIVGVESRLSFRSGIVASDYAQNGAITGNHCHSNKIDTAANQGGWGIVLSVGVSNIAISDNICVNNERGACTLDPTLADGSPYESNVTVSGNIFDGSYNGLATPSTCLALNNVGNVSITGNRITNAKFLVYTLRGKGITVSGNYIGNVFDPAFSPDGGYAIQLTATDAAVISDNVIRGIDTHTSLVGAIALGGCKDVKISGNQIDFVFGQRPFVSISDAVVNGSTVVSSRVSVIYNSISKETTGSSHCIYISGGASGVEISNNRILSSVTAWQYYLLLPIGATASGIFSSNNFITGVTSDKRLYNPNSAGQVTIFDDIFLGEKNWYASAPTSFSSPKGQTAVIAGALKMWNGTAWV